MGIDEILKFIRMLLLVVVPIITFFLGYKFLRKMEYIKHSSSAEFDASGRRAEAIVESHQAFQKEVLSLLSETDLLVGQLQAGSQNSDEAIKIQERMNTAKPTIHKAAVELFGRVSNTSSNSKEIQESTDEILSLVKSIFNTKDYKREEIFDELTRLRGLIEDAEKEIVSKPA